MARLLTSYQAKAIRNATVRRLFEPGVFVVDAVSGDRRSVHLRPVGAPYGQPTDTPVSSLTAVSFAGDMIPLEEWTALH